MGKSAWLLGMLALTLAACGQSSGGSEQQGSDLTGLGGVERGIHFEGEVLVPTTASDADIDSAILKQTQGAIGSLRADEVALARRHTEGGVDRASWQKTTLRVTDPATGSSSGNVLKVRYRYDDRAIVAKKHDTKSALGLTLLASDYESKFAQFGQQCSEDGSLIWYWYHFKPQNAACRTLISNEGKAVAAERLKLGEQADAIGPTEARRVFVSATAKLDPPSNPSRDFYPEYDRLFSADKKQVVVYAFLGVDKDHTNPDDYLVQEGFRFYRELLKAQPNLRPVHTEPFVMMQDVFVGGAKVQNVTYDRMFKWILDRSDYPTEVGSDANKIAELRKAVLSAFVERWIYWDVPLEVTQGDSKRTITLEIRSYFGREEGDNDVRMHAKWRFLEAFWYGDVFLYNGHSHLGYSALSTEEYGSWNFNDRYQVMMIQSCISFNYYRGGYMDLKPGGTKNLDTISNGLSSYINGSGVASARFIAGLFDGGFRSYRQLLESMRVDVGFQSGYEPLRVADGEIDNAYDPARTPMTLRALAPVY
jgi:hypothetical protein